MQTPPLFIKSYKKHFPIDFEKDFSIASKEALVLQSAQGTGKTNTFHHIHDFLKNLCDATVVPILLPEGSEWPPEWHPGLSKDDDFSAVFKLNGKLIYLGSSGDDDSMVKEHIKRAKANNCRIIIGASRTSGKSLDTWSASDYDNVSYFGKSDDGEEGNSSNEKRAHVVISHLLNLV